MNYRQHVLSLLTRGKMAFILVGALLVMGFGLHRTLVPAPRLEILLTAKPVPEQDFHVYFGQRESDFSESNGAVLERGVSSDGGVAVYRALFSSSEPVAVIRVDPAPKQAQVEILAMEFRSNHHSLRVSSDQLPSLFRATHDLLASPSDPSLADGARWVASVSGADPFLVLSVPEAVRGPASIFHKKGLRWLASKKSLLLGVLLLLLGGHHQCRRVSIASVQAMQRWSDALSRAAGVRIDPAALFWLLVLPLLLSVYVGLKLHNSSTGMWADKYGYPLHEPWLDRGEPQEIRSDEWFVHTPQLLNQAQTGMRAFNPNMGPPGTALVAGVPVLHPTLVANPQFWGYALFDIEHGFSWHWGVRAASLFGSVFVLMLLLTRGQTMVSWAGALAIFGSSQVQWWYASWLTELITGMSGALVGVYLWANGRTTPVMVLAALLAALSGMHAIQHPYLPALLALGYLGVFGVCAILWESHRSGVLRTQSTQRAWALALGAAVFAGLFWSYYETARQAIQTILNTTYPGKRVVIGGDLPLTDLLVGWFDFWRDKFETPLLLNSSEAARPMLVFGFVALAALTIGRKVAMGAVFWSALVYCALAMVWMHLPLSGVPGRLLGGLGFDKIPTPRMYGGLSVASWIITVIALSRFSASNGLARSRAFGLALIGALAVFAAWVTLTPLNPDYYTLERLFVSMLIIGSVLWAVVRGNSALFLAAVLLLTFKPLLVNPTSTGLNRVLDKELLHRTREMDPAGQEKWVVMGATPLSQLLRANGHEVISGDYFAPRFDLMHHFDPQERYVGRWNSYGTVNFDVGPDLGRVEFRHDVPNKPDAILVSPCHPSMQAAGVTRFVFEGRQDPSQFPCMHLIGEFEPIHVFIYGRTLTAS